MKIRNYLGVLGLAVATVTAMLAFACGGDDDAGNGTITPSESSTAVSTTFTSGGDLTIYSGRSEALVGPLLKEFEDKSGIKVSVKYGDTAALAALIVEEGSKSPADVFFAQDAGALGAVNDRKLFEKLPDDLLGKVDPKFRSPAGTWVGISGRARVIVYNPELVKADELPASVKDLTGARWKGHMGWAPTNGSFQAFVTAFRKLEGDPATETWLKAMKSNGVREYADNRAIVAAVAAGEIQVGLVNHYYLYGFIKDQGDSFQAKNYFTTAEDAGSLVNAAGAGMLASSKHKDQARALISYLLDKEAQEYFAAETFEYPLVDGIAADPRLTPLGELKHPAIDLSDLDDLEGTLKLLRAARVLP
ncbi:MAG: iron ABC transporter substrate-binding protein [Dehalococcoidia bacterium]|nr:iron ABC transporter substrate-binding protein [Dehalococcoidia bacterium]MCB9486781.1 iron ABC transporter substrate-binding protein [Thermoflexaceae bacterium]